jgi:hypothetical protein
MSLVTTEGLSKMMEAAGNEGWYIFPTKFSVSSTKGAFDASRTESSMEPTWFEAPISTRTVVQPHSIVFTLSIPPDSASILSTVKEVYIMAEDMLGADFLLAIAQPSAEEGMVYDPEGQLTFKLTITVQSLDLYRLFQFHYTQATEISEHNDDPHAHPELQHAMVKAGIFVQESDFRYEGQIWDEFAEIEEGLTHGTLVVRHSDGVYRAALASGSEPACVGMLYKYKFATPWQPDHYYTPGMMVYPSTPNDHTYVCINGGESSASGSEPAWPLVSGSQIDDNTIRWEEHTVPYVLIVGMVELIGADYPYASWLFVSDTVPGQLTTTKTILRVGVSLGNDLMCIFPTAIPTTLRNAVTYIDTWTPDGLLYYADILTSGFDQDYLHVTCYDSSGLVCDPYDIEKITGEQRIRIWMPIDTETLRVVLTG